MWVTVQIVVFVIYCIIICGSLNLLTHSHVCQICPRMSNIVLQMHSCVHIHEWIIACELLVCTSTLVCRKYVFVCVYEHWYGHCCRCCYREHRSSAERSEAELEETVVETFSTWGKLRFLSGLVQTAWPDNSDMQQLQLPAGPGQVTPPHHSCHNSLSPGQQTVTVLNTGCSLEQDRSSRFWHINIQVLYYLIVCVTAGFVSCMDNVVIKELIR